MELEKMKNELAQAQAAEDTQRAAEKAEAERLAEMQAAVDAEEKRLNSKQYRDALKTIDEMAIEAEARKQTMHELVDSIVAEFEAWEDIVSKRKALAKEHRIEINNLIQAEMAIGGNVIQLRKAIREWKQRIAWRETFSNMSQPQKPEPERQPKRDSEYKRMMKKRYPDGLS
jgi:hypothetical protein